MKWKELHFQQNIECKKPMQYFYFWYEPKFVAADNSNTLLIYQQLYIN